MKKIAVPFLCLLLVFGLVACGEGNNDLESQFTATAETDESSLSGDRTFPIEMQLIVGTFQLEGTDLEVTADQASELLPLWKALQALSTSDTAAEEEIDAVIKQIQDVMTPEQLAAIQEMELTQDSMATLMEELDLEPGVGFPGGDREGFQGQEPPEGFPPGGFLGGEFPGGGFRGGQGSGGQGFGEGLDPEQMATLEAMREERGGFRNRASLFLIDPLIQYLEGKVE